MADESNQRGRPRDAAIDERVLAATRDSLVELGWEGTTIRGIATRAGVSRNAVIRRWPSKAWLVMHAIIGPIVELEPFGGVDRDGWVDAVIDGSFDLFRRPEVKAAVPGLLAALGEREDLRSSLFATFSGPPIDLYSEFAAGPADEQRRTIDAQALIVLASGAALFSELIVGNEAEEVLKGRLRELLQRLASDVLSD